MNRRTERPIILIDINNLIDQFDGKFDNLNQLTQSIQSHLEKLKGQIPNILIFDDQNNLFSNFLSGDSGKIISKNELNCLNVLVI